MQDPKIIDNINSKPVYYDGINYYIITKSGMNIAIDYEEYKKLYNNNYKYL